MRKTYTLLSLLFISIIVSYFVFEHFHFNDIPKSDDPIKFSTGMKDDPHARMEQEFMMLRDPETNKIPPNIFRREQEFAKNLPKRITKTLNKSNSLSEINALTWISRGPDNVGGRTRALGIDVRTTTPPNVTIIAGGISGGLWKSTNDGTSWSLVLSPSQLHSISCLAQDFRSGSQDIWYAGSGEGIGNSASGGGAYFLGDGIFKSIDNGNSWSQLSSTVSNSPQSFNSDFEIVWNIATDPSNSSDDELYAACLGGIQRSTDGGSSWTRVRGAFAGSYFTDVQVTSTGIVYATLSTDYLSGGPTNPGIWRSVDGTNWTEITPAGFPSTYYRIVIGISPSNEDLIYFLGETTGGTSTLGHSLWRYDASGPSWSDRSANIPAFGGYVGDFDSQGSYDLVIKVKSDDPDFVIIGGTNLYRSTDGFSTSGNITWIGGYSPANDVTIYPNQHPDQHAVSFLPGSNKVVYTGHDGGISLTNDITTSFGGNEPVTWTSLNNSYHSTQFYSISLAPESESNAMMGGMQDNGTWFGDAAGSSNWTYYESGDGTIVEVAPSADNRVYTAYQNGGVRRRTRAGVYLVDFTPNSYNNLFVNPQVLDPNNSSLFYYAGGGNPSVGGVWRNDNVINATGTTGWSYLNSTSIGYYVTAIGVSTSNNANVVYYGSNTGPINRIDGANSGKNPSVTAVKGTLPDGYVSCIAVDPTNSGNVLLIFSNYNIQSLWYSTNSGTNWTDVEGNLAGTSGPSVRWATIFYVDGVPHYFLATSIGVFYTNVLDGSSTIWTQEAVSEIGNVVCTMLDWRDNDGTLAVATHGLGIFTTQIIYPLPVELFSFTANIVNNTVQLNWRTESEVNNYGFEINRKQVSEDTKDNKWTKIGFVEGSGNSNSTKDYSYTDRTAGYGSYNYRLKQIDNDGQFNYSDVVQVDMGTLPGKFELEQNYPNPFNPSTKIRFASASEQNVTLKIYDITGNYITTLFNEKATAKRIYEVEFNGSKFASGIYIYQLKAGDFVETKKMLLLK